MATDELTTKRCTKCSAVKALVDFPRDKKKRDLLGSQCRSCKNASRLAWAKRNKDKVKANQDRWLADRAEHRKSWRDEYERQNRERHRDMQNARRQAKPEQYREAERRRYHANPDHYRQKNNRNRQRAWLENPDIMRERQRQQYAKNPGPAKHASKQGRARRLGAEGTYERVDILWIFTAQRGRCAYCKARIAGKYEIDHIHPLAKGGTNDRRNLQLTCQTCNRRKHAKDPLVFARATGRLL